jgi:hypothetical protein
MDGKPAKEIAYTIMSTRGVLTKSMEIIVPDGRSYYNFGSKFSAYDQYFPIAKTMFDSFRTLP